MEHQIELTAQHRPEVLERILRVARHRGFTVTKMEMELIDDKVRLKFTVKSDRTLELLVSQLEKIYDVIEVR
ncbi:acetolactate synthase 2 small subunit [Aggregatibacter kilianii]|uniref:acetolactate synthase 2 small subunit n=1 Tax=Aggregatibacter kilianii TaxID=2025884 RepID=UPI000D64529D|nr:acetolactate synthase 2 small subunit [Aggregatibacter kilianii]